MKISLTDLGGKRRSIQAEINFEDIFFLDVTSTITGTGTLLIMVQPILDTIWIGNAVVKSMTLQ